MIAAPDASLMPDVADPLARPYWQLRFDPELETRFEAATAEKRTTYLRRFIAVLLVLDLAALGLDAAHGALTIGSIIRLGLITPLCLASLTFLSPRHPVWLQGCLASMPVAASIGGIFVIAVGMNGTATERYIFAAGILAMCVNFAMPLRFIHAAMLSLINIGLSFLVLFAARGISESTLLIDVVAFNAVLTLVTMRVSYRLDRSNRDAFLYGLRDRSQREALIQANFDLQKISATDGMTGLTNRRALDTAIQNMWSDASKDCSWLGLLMIDVDHFKAFNDAAGHGAGDQCLQIVAGLIKSAVRPGLDVAARYGGEEFAVILPGADGNVAQEVAERIRQAVEVRSLEHPGLQAGRCVTISIGCVGERAGTSIIDRPEMLFLAADKALYRAKCLGRNQVQLGSVVA